MMMFHIKSGSAIVTDPCYIKDSHGNIKLNNVRNGIWNMRVVISNEGVFGNRVSELICTHSDCSYFVWEESDEIIGVDSGQAGVFDLELYAQDEAVGIFEFSERITNESIFYDACCDITCNWKEKAGCIEYGAVSSSGFGDGSYPVFVGKGEDGEIVAISILFIDLDNEEDFEKDEYEDTDEDEEDEDLFLFLCEKEKMEKL